MWGCPFNLLVANSLPHRFSLDGMGTSIPLELDFSVFSLSSFLHLPRHLLHPLPFLYLEIVVFDFVLMLSVCFPICDPLPPAPSFFARIACYLSS
jgi:hypothetical protein